MTKIRSQNRAKFLALLNKNLELIPEDKRTDYINDLLDAIYNTYEESLDYAEEHMLDFEKAYFVVRRQGDMGINLCKFRPGEHGC
jgi:hypothetical protein